MSASQPSPSRCASSAAAASWPTACPRCSAAPSGIAASEAARSASSAVAPGREVVRRARRGRRSRRPRRPTRRAAAAAGARRARSRPRSRRRRCRRRAARTPGSTATTAAAGRRAGGGGTISRWAISFHCTTAARSAACARRRVRRRWRRPPPAPRIGAGPHDRTVRIRMRDAAEAPPSETTISSPAPAAPIAAEVQSKPPASGCGRTGSATTTGLPGHAGEVGRRVAGLRLGSARPGSACADVAGRCPGSRPSCRPARARSSPAGRSRSRPGRARLAAHGGGSVMWEVLMAGTLLRGGRAPPPTPVEAG